MYQDRTGPRPEWHGEDVLAGGRVRHAHRDCGLLATRGAVLAALLVVLAATGILRPGSVTDGPDTTRVSAPQPVRVGDEVTGVGVIVRSDPLTDATPTLCGWVEPATGSCVGAPVPVLLVGLDGELTGVPGVHRTGSATASARVVVEGVYLGGSTLRPTAIRRAGPGAPPADDGDSPPVPCAPPAGGWPTAESDPRFVDDLHALEDYVHGHPDRFSGRTVSLTPEEVRRHPSTYRAVAVVGTTGDVARARAELAPLYPPGVCVVHVRYSARDLHAFETELNAGIAPDGGARTDEAHDRVEVVAAALDVRTLAAVQRVTVRSGTGAVSIRTCLMGATGSASRQTRVR